MIDAARLERDRCGVARGVVPAALISKAREETAHIDAAGTRNPLASHPGLRAVADCPELRALVGSLLGDAAVLTRAILFDKTSTHNWPVPPHRDTTVAVAERIETPGFGPWSVKDGVHHVRPPGHVLGAMWTLRVALDPASESNGPLKVQLGSHAEDEPTGEWAIFTTEPGDIVLMKPLAFHSSDRSREPSRRRVLHLEWAPGPLPAPLAWAAV